MFSNDRTVCLVFTKYYMAIYSNGSTSPLLARGPKCHQKCYHFWLCDRNWSGVCSTENSLPRLVILALLPVGWNQTCYAKFQKEGRTELKEQEPWHWNNQSQISFIERGAAWISHHYQVCWLSASITPVQYGCVCILLAAVRTWTTSELKPRSVAYHPGRQKSKMGVTRLNDSFSRFWQDWGCQRL